LLSSVRRGNTVNAQRRILQCLLAAVVLAAGIAARSAMPTTVYPAGSFPLDVANVQAAIDRGGIVLLKATNASGAPTPFDFGPADPFGGTGVNLNTDVSILGERIGKFQTVIKGGFIPILGFVPVKSRIQGIHFDGPLDSPIVLVRSTGADIVGNVITGIVPLPLAFGGSEIEGILVSGADDPANAVTGRLNVIGNTIDISGGDFVNGINLDEVSADIVVKGNDVEFSQSDGVIQSIGILVIRSHGSANISQNDVTMGSGNPAAFPVAIFVGGHAEAAYKISGNSIVTRHPNADGIDVVGHSSDAATQQAMVNGNSIAMQSTSPDSGGLVFQGAVGQSTMVANRVRGHSGNAIRITGVSDEGGLIANSNRALGNDISQLSSVLGDVLLGFGSMNTTVLGRCGTFIDLGVANRIRCGMPVAIPGAPSILASRHVATALAEADSAAHARLDAIRNRVPH
jgi:hypothetical protein